MNYTLNNGSETSKTLTLVAIDRFFLNGIESSSRIDHGVVQEWAGEVRRNACRCSVTARICNASLFLARRSKRDGIPFSIRYLDYSDRVIRSFERIRSLYSSVRPHVVVLRF